MFRAHSFGRSAPRSLALGTGPCGTKLPRARAAGR